MINALKQLIEIAKGNGAVLAAIVAGAVALILAFLTPLANWFVTRAASLREIRSRSRQQWVDGFRADAAEFVTVIEGIQNQRFSNTSEQRQLEFRRDELFAGLMLRLDLSLAAHQRFESSMRSLLTAHPGASLDLGPFVNSGQDLLTKELNKLRQGK